MDKEKHITCISVPTAHTHTHTHTYKKMRIISGGHAKGPWQTHTQTFGTRPRHTFTHTHTNTHTHTHTAHHTHRDTHTQTHAHTNVDVSNTCSPTHTNTHTHTHTVTHKLRTPHTPAHTFTYTHCLDTLSKKISISSCPSIQLISNSWIGKLHSTWALNRNFLPSLNCSHFHRLPN